jgi:hypothetical protein
MRNFLPDPTVEEPEIAWAGAVSISYWKRQGLLQFEAWGLCNGEQHCVRSFTLRVKRDLANSPQATKLLEDVLKDARRLNQEASDES